MFITMMIYMLLVVINLGYTYTYHKNIYCVKNASTGDYIGLSFIPVLVAICIIMEKKALFTLNISDCSQEKNQLEDGFGYLDDEKLHCCYIYDNKLYKFNQYPDIRAKNSQKIFARQMSILKDLDRKFTTIRITYDVNSNVTLHNKDS